MVREGVWAAVCVQVKQNQQKTEADHVDVPTRNRIHSR